MGFRLKTSKKTKEIFEEVGRSYNLKPFALSKIAVSLSLKSKEPIDQEEEKDVNGLELQRSTVTGEYDAIFKALIEMNLGRNITEDEYYPKYMKLHMDRGAELLYSDFRYSKNNLEKFINNKLIKEGENI
ncbi:DndE family protein [uncultured Clostridium sp.]|uniref:DndE family protein n=1 Tax=uncultured Clostridium sp. TaxID=59620 RepID=UPI0025FC4B4B|nr:DndE family protein [uncultured Clostridium sp.]